MTPLLLKNRKGVMPNTSLHRILIPLLSHPALLAGLLVLLIAAALIALPSSAADTVETLPPSDLTSAKTLLETKNGVVPDKVSYTTEKSMNISYALRSVDSKNYLPYIRIYTFQHSAIVQEIALKDTQGYLLIDIAGWKPGTYHINLMEELIGDESAQDTYCKNHGYPCEVSRNLDIATIMIGEPTKESDTYYTKLSGWTDMDGAYWTASKEAAK
jgi:hypothetical protein